MFIAVSNEIKQFTVVYLSTDNPANIKVIIHRYLVYLL